MTRVDFYFNVPDKLDKAVSLARAACVKKRKVHISAPDAAVVSSLEQLLWTEPTTGFFPNCQADHALALHTPLIIDWREVYWPHDDILINLKAQQPMAFTRFKHLVELVGIAETDKRNARLRYKFYRDRGYEIRNVDMAQRV